MHFCNRSMRRRFCPTVRIGDLGLGGGTERRAMRFLDIIVLLEGGGTLALLAARRQRACQAATRPGHPPMRVAT